MAEARAGARRRSRCAYKAGRDSDAKQIAELKKLYGFDKPAHVRYFEMLGNFATLRPGPQLHAEQGRLAADQGEAAGVDQPGPVDLPASPTWSRCRSASPRRCARARASTRATTLFVLIGYAIPGFVLGVFLIVLFAGGTFWEWFPLRGLTSDNWARSVVAGTHRRLLLAPDAAADLPW